MDRKEAENMQPLVLAFVGDSVHTLFVREHFARLGDYKVSELTRITKEYVNAGFQCRVFKDFEARLSQDEASIARRARNTAKGQRAKNYSAAEYNYATAFEALVGYLYLTGQGERLEELLKFSIMER